MPTSQALENYRKLCLKVEEKFEAIRSRHPARFACRRGCYGCCKPGLTVSPIEAESLKQFFLDHPERAREVEALASEDPHRGGHCAFLRADGSCAVYEARPIVCRSHGAPLQLDTGRDVCPLNFEEVSLEALDEADTIRLETLNALLSLVNRQLAPEAMDRRTPLRYPIP